MNLLESLRVALRGLSSNKMRTALTMLGIIIGVAVVILVVAIGQGAQKNVEDAVNSLGTNMLMIWPERSRVRLTAATHSSTTTTATTATSTTTSSSAASSGGGQSDDRLTLEDA